MAVLDAPAVVGLTRLQRDPAAFMREWLGADLWAKQVEIAEAVRDHRRVAVKSCHASGKSFLSARVVLWFLHAYPDSIVITTAPTANQVENILWREIRRAYAEAKRPLLGRCLNTRYEIAPGWYALGFKAEDTAPDRFQGFHAEHALVVIDEAAGVAEAVYDALDAVLTSESARLLLIGNPTNPEGKFYEAFHSARSIYHCITIAARDTPNVVTDSVARPYLITQRWIDDAIAEHGADSPYVLSRVDAVFPSLGDNTLIPLHQIEAAHRRGELPPPDGGEYEAGLDVARYGGDENALCIRCGTRVVAERAWSGMGLMETVGKVRYHLSEFPPVTSLKVDVIGVGAGVVDRLQEQGYPVVAVNVGEAANDPTKFLNRRCEMWWALRERFRDGMIDGPLGETTQGQLASVRYRYTSNRTHPVIESKEEAKKRGIRSPDRAEAVLMAFHVEPPAAGAARDVPAQAYRNAGRERHRSRLWG